MLTLGELNERCTETAIFSTFKKYNIFSMLKVKRIKKNISAIERSRNNEKPSHHKPISVNTVTFQYYLL